MQTKKEGDTFCFLSDSEINNRTGTEAMFYETK
jgi:hypothetical protein